MNTDVYNNPDKYLLPNHSILFDGVFQNTLHCKTDEIGILPFNLPALNKMMPAARKVAKRYNRKQRYLRVVVEQTIGLIKQWKIVSEEAYRGDLDDQGLNFTLCTQLTARIMRIRNAYPRGDKFMRGELEDWEKEMHDEGCLFVDPTCPELYDIVDLL